ncbi:protein of unknown function [Clostridium beijerinckii]|nr:protein of unknown function [Clostridium beijerinckii]
MCIINLTHNSFICGLSKMYSSLDIKCKAYYTLIVKHTILFER